MLYQIFLSPQVKNDVIISNEQDVFYISSIYMNCCQAAGGGLFVPTQEKKLLR